MTATTISFSRALLLIIGVALGAMAISAGAMCIPAYRWGGQELTTAVIVGCVVSFLSSCVGGVLLAGVASGRAHSAVNNILGATLARVLTMGIVLFPLVLSDWFHRSGLVVGAAFSYLLMLLVDSAITVHLMGKQAGSNR